MRYTEARLTNISMEMIRDIDKGVVNMVDNYSNSEQEPEVLPARYPNLLVNGTFGIAVGLATNIPPHNLKEVINGTLAYIDDTNIDTKGLMQYIKGPDLPTGGIVIGKNSLESAYETGNGKVTLRAKANIEKLESGRLGIVITEFPYRRSKAKLLETISVMTADKRHSKALEPISDIRDESDRTGIRAVIEFKKSVDQDMAEKVLKYLYKKTDMQSNLSFNMVAIADGKPETLGLKSIIRHYVNHQKDVVTRRTKRELEIAEKRFHIVQGFIKAINIMDQIIETIRASKSKKDAQKNLMDKFEFTDIQAEAILELMLYRLTGLEITAFEKEYKELDKKIKKLKKILGSEKELLNVIKEELIEIRDKFGSDRKTLLVEDDEEAKIDIEEIIVEEDVVITLSNEGFIKRVPLKTYNRSNTDVDEIEYREGDFNKFLIFSNTKDNFIVFTDKGNMYQTRTIAIPEMKWKEKGEKLEDIIKGINLEEEKIIDVYGIDNFTAQKDIMFITSIGGIKKTPLDKFSTNYSKLMALKLKNEDKLIKTYLMDRDREEQFIHVKTILGLDFTLEEPKLEGVDRNILPQQMFNLSPQDEVIAIEVIENYEFKEFQLLLGKDGNLREFKSGIKKYDYKISTNSSGKILLFLNNGEVIKIPAFMLQNIPDKSINVLEMMKLNLKEVSILNAIALESKTKFSEVIFFTKKGLVKKTSLEEFNQDYSITTAYKFKSEDDALVAIDFAAYDEKNDMIIITRRAMCIRFDKESVSPMGRIASGVTGISLKDDDEVLFGFVVNDKLKELHLISKYENQNKLDITSIKSQNRAGRGNNIMMLVMGDVLVKCE